MTAFVVAMMLLLFARPAGVPLDFVAQGAVILFTAATACLVTAAVLAIVAVTRSVHRADRSAREGTAAESPQFFRQPSAAAVERTMTSQRWQPYDGQVVEAEVVDHETF